MKKFCINTLVHNAKDRKRLLKSTIQYFMTNTDLNQELDWYVLVNGSTDNWKTFATQITSEFSNINWHFEHSEVNLGVGAGINKLNQISSEYEYTLFLEGDWFCVPEHVSFIPKDWLSTSLKYLDTNVDISQIVLRKYIDDTDDRQYGYGYWIQNENVDKVDTFNGIEFIRLLKREYSNNPHIRRNSEYFTTGIFPLKEFYDEKGVPSEHKDHVDWGQAEIHAESKGYNIKSVFPKFGKFIHGDGYSYDLQLLQPTGCGSCKYGLMTPIKMWCYSCTDDNDFGQFSQHQQFFERNIHPVLNESIDKAKQICRTYHTADHDEVFVKRKNSYKLSEEELNDEERFNPVSRITKEGTT